MKPGRILLVADDDPVSREIVRGVLSNDFEEVVDASNGLEARDILVERGSAIDLVVLDLHMPLLDGVSLLRELRERGLAVPVLVCSASSDLKDAVEAMKMGAKDYFEKPFETEIIRSRVRAILTEKQLRTDNESLRRELERRRAPISLVGSSPGISEVLLSIAKVARSTCTVLIRGETGTGKEMAARAVHEVGPRRGEPYQAIDCASLSATLVESELFGHEKRAFTGAQARRTGLFQSAGKGTVFLDEVGELPLEIQAKLLRVLQERQIRPIGGSAYFPFEARLVAATNRDLAAEVKRGRFREDLFHRLNVVVLTMPPLRERRTDIPSLVEFFLTKHTPPGAMPKYIGTKTLKILQTYPWPGNIRELENAIERAVNLAEGEELVPEDILPSSGGKFEEPPRSSISRRPFP
ncbi:MAG: hypothetical protein RL173_1196 [Fibrobacterota bacterium]|jgi:two-component system response regulator PilR (NtrC family)